MSFNNNYNHNLQSPAAANLELIAGDIKTVYERLRENRQGKNKTKAFKVVKTAQKSKTQKRQTKLTKAESKMQSFEKQQAVSNEVEAAPINTALFQLGSEANVNQLEQYRELSALLPTNEQVKLPSTQSKINLAELIHTQEQKQIQQENKVFSRRLSSNLFNHQYRDPVSLRLHLKNKNTGTHSLVGAAQTPNSYSQLPDRNEISNLLLLFNPVTLAFSFVVFKKLMEKLLETTRHRFQRPLRIFRVVKKRLVKRALKKVERLRGGFNSEALKPTPSQIKGFLLGIIIQAYDFVLNIFREIGARSICESRQNSVGQWLFPNDVMCGREQVFYILKPGKAITVNRSGLYNFCLARLENRAQILVLLLFIKIVLNLLFRIFGKKFKEKEEQSLVQRKNLFYEFYHSLKGLFFGFCSGLLVFSFGVAAFFYFNKRPLVIAHSFIYYCFALSYYAGIAYSLYSFGLSLFPYLSKKKEITKKASLFIFFEVVNLALKLVFAQKFLLPSSQYNFNNPIDDAKNIDIYEPYFNSMIEYNPNWKKAWAKELLEKQKKRWNEQRNICLNSD